VVIKYIKYLLRVVLLSNCCSTITQSHEKVLNLKLTYTEINSDTAKRKIFVFNAPTKMHLKYILLQLLHCDMFRHDMAYTASLNPFIGNWITSMNFKTFITFSTIRF
jgi:hypothetical protein